MTDKVKTKSCRFSDKEWELIKQVSRALGHTTTASYLRSVVNGDAQKQIAKINKEQQ